MLLFDKHKTFFFYIDIFVGNNIKLALGWFLNQTTIITIVNAVRNILISFGTSIAK